MLYEQDIQLAFMDELQLLPDLGEYVVLREKGFVMNNSRADLLIFSDKQGIIGIEIKTEADSTSRLKSQMDNYDIVCDYVYVLCHEKHVEKVEKTLRKNHKPYVGILSYIEFRGLMIVGEHRKAYRSPKKSVHMAWQMVWKADILKVLYRLIDGQSLMLLQGKVGWENNNPYRGKANQNAGESGISMVYNRKGDLIHMIRNWLGDDNANNLLCRWFITRDSESEQIPLLRYQYYKKD